MASFCEYFMIEWRIAFTRLRRAISHFPGLAFRHRRELVVPVRWASATFPKKASLRNSLISLLKRSLNVAALCAAMHPKCGTSASKYRDVDPGFVERSNILLRSSLSYAQMVCAD